MTIAQISAPTYRRHLGEDLVVRWSTAADSERIGQLHAFVFRNKSEDPLNNRVAAWTGELMSGQHPLITPDDFALVEDTSRKEIVAATCLMSQTWEYEDIPFPVGRPEIVASLPDYRNRGLIRAIFDLIHARSAAMGHLVQGITGIPYYYRQFGYEYALDLESFRTVALQSIPKLKQGETEPYSLRKATLDDLALVMELYDRERARSAVSTRIDEAYWRYVLEGRGFDSGERWDTYLLVNNEAHPIGYVLVRQVRWGDALSIIGVAMERGFALITVLPSLLRGLQQIADTVPPAKPDTPPPTNLRFVLGCAHPLYEALGETIASKLSPPYAWYVRVPDLPRFIMHIAPALARRLTDSVATNYTGAIKIDFYRGGLQLVFQNGRLTTAEHWHAPIWSNDANAAFPPLVFLQLLFGHRSLSELQHAFPDVWARDTIRPVLEVLFPQHTSWVLHLD